MKKKGYLYILLLAVVCAGGLFYSMTVYNSKIRDASVVKSAEQAPSPSTNKDTATEPEAAPTPVMFADDLFPEVKSLLSKRLDDGENVQLLIIGSRSIQPVTERFAAALTEKMGDSITVDAVTADLTSAQFIEQGLPKIDWSTGYDVIIYEPFTLKNNGNVVIEQEQQDLLKVKQAAQKSVQDAAFIVTPPQPILKANYYDSQIAALKKFTSANGIPYVEHWPSWPPTNSDELLNYVRKDQSLTDQGVKTWSDALIQTFLK
ncbi:hypothetical protein [Sporosarcina gallistercoris]|uniref:SGNH/GDSL hydrolase family protein n=1 Tax=Sporosarcina gallistercoris TaxID=2762245 RepID=A0ABR8PMJ5_9BACL|nr:hypothetical protein [Sporosarcina gallistercoris]MBD7909408.1 hypothetical protein [Sporosarcina gallistercoris]